MLQTKEMFVHYNDPGHGTPGFELYAFDATSIFPHQPLVCKATVTFETPDDFNPVAAKMSALKAKEAQVVKEFTDRLREVREEISKLESLEFIEPTEAPYGT